MQHAIKIEQARPSGQDRARLLEVDNGLVIALADGAGGTANGAIAAQAIVDSVAGAGARDWIALLTELDADGARLGHGESTAIVLAVTRDGIRGASVGDSEAWLVRRDDIVELTEHQVR
jgi:PPM family protein phosphatase